jgi:hypothetical protein
MDTLGFEPIQAPGACDLGWISGMRTFPSIQVRRAGCEFVLPSIEEADQLLWYPAGLRG